MRHAVLTFMLALVLGSAAVGQEKPPLPDTWGRYWPDWGHEWSAVSVVLEPDGSVSSRVPDRSREKLEEQKADFKRLFGSAADHGLREGQVAPKKFCPPKGSIAWGDMAVANLGSVLLLSEVAVKASVDSVALGFGTGGYPKALIRLANVVPLTERSPLPEYAVLPLGQLVVRDHVFCGHRGQLGTGDFRGPYEPRVGSQIVLIGGWRNGTVFMGSDDAWYAELSGDVLEWRFGGYEGRTLGDITRLIWKLEASGAFERTGHLARPDADRMERMRLGQAWELTVRRGCEPAVVGREGGVSVGCEIEQ